MKTKTYSIRGTVSLLMHNGRLANPLDKYTKALKKVSGKGKKTEEDHEAMANIEARASLYYNEADGYFLPGENVEACLLSAAKLQRLGTTLKRGARVVDMNCPLSTKAPNDPDKLAQNPDFLYQKLVKVGTSRVVRTRPIFNEWSTTFTIGYLPDQIDEESIDRIVKDAGELIGLGDWRPRFGLFEIV